MKKTILILLVTLLCLNGLKAQVLDVPLVTQEQNQWCWAGVTSCILSYYSHPISQCEIAEYARSVITWKSFGTVNCCDNPSQGCNNTNFLWGYEGSIQDILLHFDNITAATIESEITEEYIAEEIDANRPIIIRWGWAAGGGHFLIIHGIQNDNVYYMNPWFGEGKKIANYSWMVSGADHSWTHTLTLTADPPVDNVNDSQDNNNLYRISPNPVADELNIEFSNQPTENVQVYLCNIVGEKIVLIADGMNNLSRTIKFNTSSLSPGCYYIIIKTNGKQTVKSIIKED